MTATLEQYVAEATNAYKPSTNAIQSQIDALQGNLDKTKESINRDYAQQQANLNLASNQAAEAASMSAAGNGGSFGGAGNLARRKYYEQSFVPAVTQLQTNRANDLAAAQQASDNTRLQLNQKLADVQSQASNQATQQYYATTEAQKTRDFQAEQSSLDRQFNEAQAQLNREWQDYLADKQYKNEAIEAEKVRQFQAEQAELERQYNAEQARLNREFEAAQNAESRRLQQQQIDADKEYNQYLMKANSVKSWDFGNGYTLEEGPNNLAIYRKNGTAISPGEFLEGTGESGANWNLWKDVWNEGVGTSGVGSGAIADSDRQKLDRSKYSYLYN